MQIYNVYIRYTTKLYNNLKKTYKQIFKHTFYK